MDLEGNPGRMASIPRTEGQTELMEFAEPRVLVTGVTGGLWGLAGNWNT